MHIHINSLGIKINKKFYLSCNLSCLNKTIKYNIKKLIEISPSRLERRIIGVINPRIINNNNNNMLN